MIYLSRIVGDVMKQKRTLLILTILTIISFVGGISYAWFLPSISGNENAMANRFDSGTISLRYNGANLIQPDLFMPGDTDSLIFIVSNYGTLPVSGYDIYMNDLTNEFINDEVVYTITCQKSDGTSCTGLTERPAPTSSGLIFSQSSIAPSISHIYTLTIEFIDTGSEQNYNANKLFTFKIGINDPPRTYLIKGPSDNPSDPKPAFWNYRANITSITFDSSINIPGGATSWDVSQLQNGEMMAYIVDDGLGTNSYALHIQSDYVMYANEDSSYLFYNFEDITVINNINLLNFSEVTNMAGMFQRCISITSLNLTSLDPTNVTSMHNMFLECNSVTSINLTDWHTSNVLDMSGMFRNCLVLTSLSVTGFDTSNVTDMNYMFYRCESISILTLTALDTSSVTDVSFMFQSCLNITELHIEAFDFSSVLSYTNMLTSFAATSYSNEIIATIHIASSQQTFVNSRISDANLVGKVSVVV